MTDTAYLYYRDELRENKCPGMIVALCDQFPELNAWHFWMILNDDDYRPSKRVAKILGLHKPRRRLVIDLPPDTPAEALARIRALSKGERLDRLTKGCEK